MTGLPVDLALTLAGVGIDISLTGDELEVELCLAIAARRGYFDGPEMTATGYAVELLSPNRQTFEGRTPVMALAWCLVFLPVNPAS